jgi:hypothetical protein
MECLLLDELFKYDAAVPAFSAEHRKATFCKTFLPNPGQ